jgi:hypothetical protein
LSVGSLIRLKIEILDGSIEVNGSNMAHQITAVFVTDVRRVVEYTVVKNYGVHNDSISPNRHITGEDRDFLGNS